MEFTKLELERILDWFLICCNEDQEEYEDDAIVIKIRNEIDKLSNN
jgi:hypothetical protein